MCLVGNCSDISEKKPFMMQSKTLTFDVVVDNVVRVQVLQASQNLLRDPDDLELSHRTTALQLLQNRAPFACFHEQMHRLLPQQCPIELSYVLVPEPGLDFHICRLEMLHRNLEEKYTWHLNFRYYESTQKMSKLIVLLYMKKHAILAFINAK